MFIAVKDKNNVTLMPCHPARARELVRAKKAIRRFHHGIFFIQLNYAVKSNNQQVVIGIDPGSKREGFTVMSEKTTYLNIQSHAVTHVKDKLETRRIMRRIRRSRKTPCRKSRRNRNIGGISPSTHARWNAKLRILNMLSFLYPITDVIVEDIKAKSVKNGRKWNVSFSPLQVGKMWFYKQIEKNYILHLKFGYETKMLRDKLNLKKTSAKLSNKFSAHCVDSWVLANYVFPKRKSEVDNKKLIIMVPFNFIRRQLHKLQPNKDGIRIKVGGTNGLMKKGAMVLYKNKAKYIGGCNAIGCDLKDHEGKRTNRLIIIKNLQLINNYNSMGVKYL